MKKNVPLICLFIVLQLSFFAQNNKQQAAEQLQVKAAATQHYSRFLSLIPRGREQDYGFQSRADFEQVKIEEPYRFYYLTISNNKLGIQNTTEWRVPLSVNGKFIALLTVQLNKGTASVVDFGANLLAIKIQEFESTHPGINDRVVIRNTFLRKDFLFPEFNQACSLIADANSYVIKTTGGQLLFEINAGTAKAVSLSDFKASTLSAYDQHQE